eukprot:GEMP01052373.1.p1 GENE.GEMP01052373.1~~GEMP01052373.1.p1  ORF type:complete len:348 (+),score=70.37 GEMP01052373.1:315-1358(+)
MTLTGPAYLAGGGSCSLYAAWAAYAAVVAVLLPFLIRRLIVETFKCPEVQRVHVAPINGALEKQMPFLLSSSLLATSKNVEAANAVAGLLLSEKMQRIMNESAAETLGKQDFVRNFVLLQAPLFRHPRMKAGIKQIFLRAMKEEQMRDATKLIIIESLVNVAVQRALLDTFLKMGKRLCGAQDAKYIVLKQNVKEALMEVLHDEEFGEAIVKGGFEATKTVIKSVIIDPELVEIFRDLMKDTLGDEEIHKAHRQGAMHAMKPKAIIETTKKVEEMRDTVNSFAESVMNTSWNFFHPTVTKPPTSPASASDGECLSKDEYRNAPQHPFDFDARVPLLDDRDDSSDSET